MIGEKEMRNLFWSLAAAGAVVGFTVGAIFTWLLTR